MHGAGLSSSRYAFLDAGSGRAVNASQNLERVKLMTTAGLALTLGLMAFPAQAADCAFEGASRAAVERALSAWDRLDHIRIHAMVPVRPIIQVFDLRCQYALTPSDAGAFRVGDRAFDVEGHAHHGTIRIADAAPFPVGRISYASNDENGGSPTFVISLPDVWATDAADARDPGQLFMAVFMHEFSHVQHMAGLNPRFEALEAAGYSGFEMGDDVMQRTFAQDPDYLAAYRQEMEVLTAAATAPDRGTTATKLAEARALIAARRERWFSGPDRAGWAAADDVFLTLEGGGQWAAYSWMIDPQGGGLAPEAALAAMRTRWWSQEAGMMLMLAIDRLLPEWPTFSFGPDGVTIDELLDRALGAAGPPGA